MFQNKVLSHIKMQRKYVFVSKQNYGLKLWIDKQTEGRTDRKTEKTDVHKIMYNDIRFR